MNAWLGLRRPLFISFFIGCTVSLLSADRLTLRLLLPAMIYWSFVPLVEIAALVAVCWRDRNGIFFPSLVDSFFSGYRPWLLWLAGMCVFWVLMSPVAKPLELTISVAWLDGGAVAAITWSLYIDFHFFSSVLKRTPAGARRTLLMHRLISWGLILPILGGPTIWQGLTGRLW